MIMRIRKLFLQKSESSLIKMSAMKTSIHIALHLDLQYILKLIATISIGLQGTKRKELLTIA